MRLAPHGKKARRLLFAAFPAAAVTLGAFTLPIAAQADAAYNTTTTVSGIVYNPCNGESVTVSGQEHDDYSFKIDNGGGVHGSIHINLAGVTGVGDQGNKYQVPGVFNYQFNGNVGSETTFVLNERYVSQGSAPNFVMQDRFHITVNANGTVTSYHERFTSDCKA